MSPEDPVRNALTDLDTAGPSRSYTADLRRRLREEMVGSDPSTNSEVEMITETNRNNRTTGDDGNRRPNQRLALVALVATVLVALAIGALWSRDTNNTSTDQSPVDGPTTTAGDPTTTTELATTVVDSTASEALVVGNAWVASIVDNDRAAFEALHAPTIDTNDTLMAWTLLVLGGMSQETVADLYFDGFDAFQASIETDEDFIDVDGCELIPNRDQLARCSYRASLVGGEETFTVRADLTVEDGLITNVSFATGNEPADLMSRLPRYFIEFGTEQDNACREIGFNSVECGQHESDLLTRYLDFLEEPEGS